MEMPDLLLIDELLASPDATQWVKLLDQAHFLSCAGIEQLLDEAARLVRDDPARGRELALRCAAVAAQIEGAAIIAPRAAYIQAQAHAMNAEYDAALDLIDRAHDEYMVCGQVAAALRTHIGRLNVLRELGRYSEVLATGQTILAAITSLDDDSQLLMAMVQQNCGLCYEQMGHYEQALQTYAQAEQAYARLDMLDRLGEISNNRGIVLLSLGRASEALIAFEQAVTTFANAELTLRHAEACWNCGNAHLLLGHYTQALAVFEQARQLFAPLDAQANKTGLLLDTAAAYLALNLYPEALAAYCDAAEQLAVAQMPYDQARALWGAGAVMVASGRWSEAAQMLDQAATLFAQTNNAPLQASVLLEQAALQESQGQHAQALARTHQALALVSDHDWPVEQIYAHLRLADLALPDLNQAENHLRTARRLMTHVTMPQLRYRLNQRLGNLRRLQGNPIEAERLLVAALDTIEDLRGQVGHETFRVSFLRDKIGVYEDLLRLYLERADQSSILQAFVVTERSKSRALLDLLQQTTHQRRTMAKEIPTPIQTLQEDLHSIYNELLGALVGSRHRIDFTELRARAFEIEQELSRLRLQAAAGTIQHDPRGTPLAPADIVARLPVDTALVAYHMLGDQFVAFVGINYTVQVIGPFGSSVQVQNLIHRLEMQWDRVRASEFFVPQHVSKLEQATQRVLQALYNEVFAPIQRQLVAQGMLPTRLVVVPHGVLHNLPFHALYDGNTYLIETYEMVYAPSATIWALCQERPLRQHGSVIAFGLSNETLPSVADELAAVVGDSTDAESFVNHHATLAQIRDKAAAARALHIACHGQFRDDNPAFSGLQLFDGWLTAADALELQLQGALVTLSACESGRGQVQRGDEVIGLIRAFLGAGATTVVASLWLAHDASTAYVMAKFYAALRSGSSPMVGLRQAQLTVKQKYPHPFFWAAFFVVGWA